MARLPTVGSDIGGWGTVLNDFLDEEHRPDGSHGSAKFYGPKPWVDVESRGVVVGAGQSQATRLANRTSLQTAVNDAAGGVLYARGVIEVEFDAANPRINVSSSMHIIGAGVGWGQTTFKAFPDSAGFSFSLFRIAAGVEVVFANFTLQGPAISADHATLSTYAIEHMGTSGDLKLYSVKITGKVTNGISLGGGTAPGTYLTEIVGCDLEAAYEVLTGSASDAIIGKAVHVRDTTFRNIPDVTTNQYHLVYLNPNIAVWFSHCRFLNTPTNAGYAIHHHGTATLPADYAVYEKCFFGSGLLGAGAIRASNTTISEIIAPTFRNASGGGLAVRLQTAGVLVRGGFFYCAKAFDVIAGAATPVVRIHGAHLECTGSTWIDCKYAGSTWIIRDCTLKTPAGVSVSNAFIASENDDLNLTVEECLLIGGGTETRVGIDVFKGKVVIRRNVFEGAFTNGAQAAIFFAGGTLTSLVIDGNDFSGMTAGRAINANHAAGADSGKIRGKDNIFGTSVPFCNTAGTYHLIEPRTGVNPVTIASAATLQPSLNYEVQHVTGNTTIDNIKFGNSDTQTRMMAGRLTLIMDGTAAFSAAGNIKAKTGAARAVDEVVTVIRDPRTDFWYEEG